MTFLLMLSCIEIVLIMCCLFGEWGGGMDGFHNLVPIYSIS